LKKVAVITFDSNGRNFSETLGRLKGGAMSNRGEHFYEFGAFVVDEGERALLRKNRPVPITLKAFDTLLLLVRNAGHIVDKDELLRVVWPDTVVEENNLNQ